MSLFTMQNLLDLAAGRIQVLALNAQSADEAFVIRQIIESVVQKSQEGGTPNGYAWEWKLGSPLKLIQWKDGEGLVETPSGFNPTAMMPAEQLVQTLNYFMARVGVQLEPDQRAGEAHRIAELNAVGKHFLILPDTHIFFEEGVNSKYYAPVVARMLKTIASRMGGHGKFIYLMGQGLTVPPDYLGIVHQIDVEPPSKEEIEEVLDLDLALFEAAARSAAGVPEGRTRRRGQANNANFVRLTPGERDLLVTAFQGLSRSEVDMLIKVYGRKNRCIDAELRKAVMDYKIDKLKHLGIDFEPPPTVEIGGLENLKSWLTQQHKTFSPLAATMGLRSPKGMLLVGVQGCGKSLVAKTVAQQYGIPTLSFDISSLMGNGLLGQTENRWREFLRIVDNIGAAVLLIDEIEKAFAGAGNNARSDGGATDRTFGMFLKWLQDHTSPIFVVATANNITKLPPEFVRKGRFDEIFFVDLPNEQERENILNLHIQRYRKESIPEAMRISMTSSEVQALARYTHEFSGAELAALVDAMALRVFQRITQDGSIEELNNTAENPEILQEFLDSLLQSPEAVRIGIEEAKALADEIIPLAKQLPEAVNAIREWGAAGHARPASAGGRSRQQRQNYMAMES